MVCFTLDETNKISQGPANIHIKYSTAKYFGTKTTPLTNVLLVELTDVATFHEKLSNYIISLFTIKCIKQRTSS